MMMMMIFTNPELVPAFDRAKQPDAKRQSKQPTNHPYISREISFTCSQCFLALVSSCTCIKATVFTLPPCVSFIRLCHLPCVCLSLSCARRVTWSGDRSVLSILFRAVRFWGHPGHVVFSRGLSATHVLWCDYSTCWGLSRIMIIGVNERKIRLGHAPVFPRKFRMYSFACVMCQCRTCLYWLVFWI